MRADGSKGESWEHVKERRWWASIVKANATPCSRCGQVIIDGKIALRRKDGSVLLVSNWHLDHEDDRSGYRGPSHLRCNTSAGGRKGARSPKRMIRRRPRVIRTWGAW